MSRITGPIRFACQGCGHCCTGEPGTVYLAPGELSAIAEYLAISTADLKRTFLYPFRDGYSIKEDDRGSCLFYEDGCRIYPVRPAQCRCYPFWRKNLESLEAWKEVERECPGIGHGPFYSEEDIRRIAGASPL